MAALGDLPTDTVRDALNLVASVGMAELDEETRGGIDSEAVEKPKSVDAYFASLEPARRASLQKLRETIAAAAPRAEEGITYGMPGFLVHGRGLVGYMAFDRHYSFFPMSPAAVNAHREELGDLVTGKGTISFEYGRRLPVTLVKKVVKTRLAEVGRQ